MTDDDQYAGSARRCTACDVNWPLYSADYVTCPLCAAPTWEIGKTRPLGPNEAKSLVAKHHAAAAERERKLAAFEAYYVDREVAKLRAELDSPLC